MSVHPAWGYLDATVHPVGSHASRVPLKQAGRQAGRRPPGPPEPDLTELWHTQFMNICNPIQGFMQILLTQAGNMSLSSFQT